MTPGGSYDLTYLSFGAGVQSTALLILSVLAHEGDGARGPGARGLDPRLFPKVDVALYADTQSELPDTDENVARMTAWAAERGVLVETITVGSLERTLLGEESARASGFSVSIPAFTEQGGMLRRQCTRHHKVDAIVQAVRRRLGLALGERAGDRRALCVLGISSDEAQRMKPSREPWITHAYPLVDARLARWDCEDVIRKAGLPVPTKSSCVFCPYHSDKQWAWIQRERPAAFARAVAVDRALRSERVAALDNARRERQGAESAYQPAFLHRDRRPLELVNFAARAAKDRAQGRLFGGDGFGNECEGMCGV